MPTRRDFCRGLAVGGVTLGLGATVAMASHADTQPDHVTVAYDESQLDTYVPELVFPPAAEEKFLGLYGAWCTSTEYDVDAAVYWASYTHQEGLSPFYGLVSDSHRGDHEPCFVFVDSDGEVVQIIASIYHWMAGKVPAADAALVDETHPHLQVIKPWHQYTAVRDGAVGTRPDVLDLTEAMPSWLRNGLEESLAPGAGLYNPWVMRQPDRESWWRRESTFGLQTKSFNQYLVETMASLNVGQLGSLEA